MNALRRDGHEFPVELSIAPVRAGGKVGFHAFVDDITKRQAAEHSLRESEERFRSLVEGVTDYAVYPLDPDGLIEGWNEGAERMYGYSREEMHGEPVTKLLRPGDATDYAEVLRQAADEGRAELEAWRVRADGTAFLANVIITPLRARSGRLRGFATITRDVTERTRAQEALARGRGALPRRVRSSSHGDRPRRPLAGDGRALPAGERGALRHRRALERGPAEHLAPIDQPSGGRQAGDGAAARPARRHGPPAVDRRALHSARRARSSGLP